MLEKEKAIEKLNEKEIKVYQYILAHSLEFPFMTIRELADKVQVSTTVILNYVKKMGYKSFKTGKHNGVMTHLIFWKTGTPNTSAMPPSHKRNFLG